MTHLRTVLSPEPRVGGPKRAQQQRPLQSLMGEEELEELPFLEFKLVGMCNPRTALLGFLFFGPCSTLRATYCAPCSKSSKIALGAVHPDPRFAAPPRFSFPSQQTAPRRSNTLTVPGQEHCQYVH